jgi:ACS family tartrate transporter-like MFS transporter
MPFLFIGYVIAYLDRINVGFAGLQMTKELGFNAEVFGFGLGIFYFGYMILGIPGAMLVERWSARRAMAITLVIWGLVAGACGFVNTQAQYFGMRFLLGMAEAAFFPGMLTYLNHWYTPKDRAKAVSMFMTALPVSQIIAAPLSAWLLTVHWFGLSGWRWLLIVEGMPALVCGVVAWHYLTDRPKDAHWLSSEERSWLITELDASHKAVLAIKKIGVWQALANRDVILICIAYIGGTTGNYGLNNWLPKILKQLGNQSDFATAMLSAIPALITLPAMLLIGWNSDRTGERKYHTTIPRLIAAAAMASVVFVGNNVPLALTMLTIAMVGIVGSYGPLWAIPNMFLSREAAASSIGLITSLGNLGGFLGPYAIGFFSQKTGSFNGGLMTMAVAVFASSALVALVGLGRKGPGVTLSESSQLRPQSSQFH